MLGHPVKLDWIIFDHLVKTHLHLSYQKLTEVFLMSLELFKSDKNHRTMVFKTDSKYFFWVRTPPPFNLSKGFGTHKFQRGEKKSSDFKPVHWTRKISKKILFFNAWHNVSKVTILSKNWNLANHVIWIFAPKIQ